ncbi:MAG TPA: substrate-binding domain-containing protein [Candidatus Agrococcus pullicola]|uniref:Substrate-binding domain-containing protein n=1 Tax=Candidatus Agrococcus pullicola TaxID=2838429 RepID=A0A9D1YVW1_9MICO|nr:substrate-binding domain-containing protein [Candidatus Agrococcus pullicola]
MFRKRLAAALAASAIALTSLGCSTGGSEIDGSESAAREHAETPRIAFVPGISSDPFFVAMEVAAQEEAAEHGFELLYQGSSSDYSPQAQLPFVDSALADDIDALIIAPTDGDALQASVQRAAALGIPVITVDTTVADQSELVSHVTGDNEDGGRQAAVTMSELIGGEGQVFVISGAPTITTDTQRVEGFVDEIEESYPDIEIVGVEYAYSQPTEATTKVNSALLNYPDLAGVFAVEGNSGVGAVAALRNADTVGDVALIGYDAYSNQVEELEQGIYSALIAQDPAEEARIAIRSALAAIEGRRADIETEVVIPNVVMTAENLDSTREYQYAEH